MLLCLVGFQLLNNKALLTSLMNFIKFQLQPAFLFTIADSLVADCYTV